MSSRRAGRAGLQAEGAVREGIPADEILADIRDWHPDLVLLGCRHKGGLERLVVGSVARDVLHHAPCSVLVAREGAKGLMPVLAQEASVATPRSRGPTGLTEHEARDRRARGLGNAAAMRGSVSVRRVLRRNVFTVLNGVLFSVSIVLMALGLVDDAFVTAGPVAANVVVAVVLELRAKRKLDRLTLINRPTVTIRRDGVDRPATVSDIVLGDVIVMERGDQAVVDGRVVAGGIEADESILTGEAEAVSRAPGDVLLSGSVCVAWPGGDRDHRGRRRDVREPARRRRHAEGRTSARPCAGTSTR